MKPPPPPGLGLVALREIRFFRRDRAGYLLVIVVPVICFAILTWTFSSAVVRGLNVIVVDADRSEVSAKLIQSIASAPGLRVAERANDLKSATRAIRSGNAIAAVYIPPRFEEDLLAVRRATNHRFLQLPIFHAREYCVARFERRDHRRRIAAIAAA